MAMWSSKASAKGKASNEPQSWYANVPRWLKRAFKWVVVVDRSLVWAIIEQLFWYGVGCWSLYTDVWQGGRPMLSDDSETEWGFGQLLPVMLLLLPALTTWEVFHGTSLIL
jgi:hypothetical protein